MLVRTEEWVIDPLPCELRSLGGRVAVRSIDQLGLC